MDTYELTTSTYETCVQPYLEDITQMRENGSSIAEICDNLSKLSKVKLPVVIFLRYMSIHEELYKAWYSGNTALTLKLEDKLIQTAMGFNYSDEETIYKCEGGVFIPVSKKVTNKYQKPDPNALRELLKVNHPAMYRDEKELENKIEVIMEDEIDDYSQ